MLPSSPGSRYPASVARPNGGKREYLIGLQNGLFASVSAGRIIFTRTTTPLSEQTSDRPTPGSCTAAPRRPGVWLRRDNPGEVGLGRSGRNRATLADTIAPTLGGLWTYSRYWRAS